MIISFRHVGLVVNQLEDSIRFWCDTMGFRIHRTMKENGNHIDNIMGLKNVKLTTVKLIDTNDNILELLKFNSHPDKLKWQGHTNSTGLTHIAFNVENLDMFYEEKKKEGILTFKTPPQTTPDGAAKMTYAEGPEGVIIELVELMRQKEL